MFKQVMCTVFFLRKNYHYHDQSYAKKKELFPLQNVGCGLMDETIEGKGSERFKVRNILQESLCIRVYENLMTFYPNIIQ